MSNKITSPEDDDNNNKKKKAKKDHFEIKDLEFDIDGIYVQNGADIKDLTTYSTGSLKLDIMTGGFTPGVMQAWGPDGIGKTTLLFIMAGEFQKAHNYEDCLVYLWATEGRYNPRLCKMAPLLKMTSPTMKTDEGEEYPIFKISRPKSGEKMYDYIMQTLKQDKVKVFHIIDSSDGIKSEANEGKTMSESEKTASTASLNTRFLKEASVYANHNGHVIAYTHQVRDKISTGHSHVSGVGKQRSGGHAVDHNSNLRMNFTKLWTELMLFENPSDTKSRIIGHKMKITLDKTSNSGNVYGTVEVPFVYNHGIHRGREIADLADKFGLISKSGAWYTMNGKNIAQGYNKLLSFLEQNPDIAKELEDKIKQTVGLL